MERALNTVMKNYTVLLTHIVAREVLLTHTKIKQVSQFTKKKKMHFLLHLLIKCPPPL